MFLENFEIIIAILNIVILGFILVLVYGFFKMEEPEVPELNDIVSKLQAVDRGVASGTARQKKVADQMLGQAMMERYPIVTTASQYYPPLGDFLQKNPNMVPYVAQSLVGIMGKVTDKMQLPDEIMQLLAGLGGSVPEQ